MAERGAIIVSGGTYGIGRAIVLELARRGRRVVAFGLEARQPGSRAENGIAGTRAALDDAGLDADLLEADVSSASDVERVVRHAQGRHGAIVGVVNNAAIRPIGTVSDTDEASFERVLAVNLKGPFLLARAALPHLRETRGAIINVGSGAAAGKPGLAAYASSKGGLHALSAALSEDHAAEGVRVHLVVPPPRTASGMLEAMGVPAGEMNGAEEVASEVADLLEPALEP